jgi:GNAT superfamily N-acetyltransferase
MKPGEEEEASKLILDCFTEFVGHEYSQEGIGEFQRYVRPDALRQRSKVDHFTLVATVKDEMAGVIEIRRTAHISLLFVDQQFHRRGIAKGLLHRALLMSGTENPGFERVTVNSLRYAVRVYEKLGFQRAGGEQTVKDIIFVPMMLDLDQRDR